METEELQSKAATSRDPSQKQQLAAATDEDTIMGVTNKVMDAPETQTRHDSIAKTRAAVAAAGQQDPSATAGDGEAGYRDVLQEMVGPAKAPKRASPPPLKLVAEQRVDGGKPAPAKTKAKSLDMTFEEYARHVNAQSLEDVLEAAAVYMSYVEGETAFSRPRVMEKVSAVLMEEVSRQEYLSVFGQMLRTGTFRRQGGGQFAVSENSKFVAEFSRAS